MSDELEYAVVFRFDRGRAAIFEGSEEAVYRWLTKIDQYSMWEVWKRNEGYEAAASFVERLAEKYKPKPQLTEEDVRKIVDKRVGEILESIGKEAENRSNGLAAYEVSDIIKRTAFSAVVELMENITDRLSGEGE